MNSVRIRQIFLDVDLRGGERSLGKLFRRASLNSNEVFLCMNRRRDIIKVLGRRGMFIDRLPAKQTFDFSLRREQILEAIGKYFGLEFNIPDNVYKTVQREVGVQTKGGDKYVKNSSVQRRRAGSSHAGL